MTITLIDDTDPESFDSYHHFKVIDSDKKIIATVSRIQAPASECWIERTYGTDWQMIGLDGLHIVPISKDRNELINNIKLHFKDDVVIH